MTTSNECRRCGRPTDAFTCTLCLDALSIALGDVPSIAEEMDITLSKQRAAATEGGAASRETALAFDLGASEALGVLRGLLVSWTRLCAEEGVRSQDYREGLPEDNLPALSRWLLWRVDGLGLHPAGSDAVDELTDAVAGCWRVIDRRPDRRYAGPCDTCSTDLYSTRSKGQIQCKECGHTYDLEERRMWLLESAEASFVGTLVTAREASERLSFVGLATPIATIDMWHHRKKLEGRGETIGVKQVRLYQWEDVHALALKAAEREAKRQADAEETRALRSGRIGA